LSEQTSPVGDLGELVRSFRPSYEQLRSSADGEAGEAWDAVDRQVRDLRRYYEKLREDERLTSDYKSEEAWKRFEAAKPKIEQGKEKTKDLLEKQIRSRHQSSIPMPKGHGGPARDTNALLVAQNEASRIVRKIDRMGDAKSRKSPFKPDKTEMLRTEYERGLEIGGVEGASICRGALAAGNELGVDVDSIVDSFRTERHRESLQRSQQAARQLDLIGSDIPQPPFPAPGQRGRGSDSPRRNKTFLVEREQPIVHGTRRSKSRKRPWK
jgi:hypothetical protein